MARSRFFALVPALKNANSALIQHEAATPLPSAAAGHNEKGKSPPFSRFY
jgi:hypothetical protein